MPNFTAGIIFDVLEKKKKKPECYFLGPTPELIFQNNIVTGSAFPLDIVGRLKAFSIILMNMSFRESSLIIQLFCAKNVPMCYNYYYFEFLSFFPTIDFRLKNDSWSQSSLSRTTLEDFPLFLSLSSATL